MLLMFLERLKIPYTFPEKAARKKAASTTKKKNNETP